MSSFIVFLLFFLCGFSELFTGPACDVFFKFVTRRRRNSELQFEMFVSSDQTSGEFRKIVVSIRILTNVFGLFQTQVLDHLCRTFT